MWNIPKQLIHFETTSRHESIRLYCLLLLFFFLSLLLALAEIDDYSY